MPRDRTGFFTMLCDCPLLAFRICRALKDCTLISKVFAVGTSCFHVSARHIRRMTPQCTMFFRAAGSGSCDSTTQLPAPALLESQRAIQIWAKKGDGNGCLKTCPLCRRCS